MAPKSASGLKRQPASHMSVLLHSSVILLSLYFKQGKRTEDCDKRHLGRQAAQSTLQSTRRALWEKRTIGLSRRQHISSPLCSVVFPANLSSYTLNVNKCRRRKRKWQVAVALFGVTHPTPTTLLQTGGAKFKLAREHLGESKEKA